MVKKADIPKHVVDTALALAAERGWRDLRMVDIAAAADLPIAAVLEAYRTKPAILAAYGRRLDQTVAKGCSADDLDQPVRDRLFDALMRRFDAMKPHRDGLRAIARDLRRDPLAALGAVCSVACSMAVMLEAAGVSASGAFGRARTKGLTAIYLSVLRVWLDDDSEDSARTMAALDRHLDNADRAMSFLCRRGGPAKQAA